MDNIKNDDWKILVSDLKEKAILKFGVGYQKILAEKTGIKAPNISRMFGLNTAPSLKNYAVLKHTIEILETKKPTKD